MQSRVTRNCFKYTVCYRHDLDGKLIWDNSIHVCAG